MQAPPPDLHLHAARPEETDSIGRRLAPVLAQGDVVALHGDLGAGKSRLARAIIRARLGEPEAEVPSPTYTLVNVYAAPGGEIWHADLYRVDPDEIGEIGLADAPGHALVLVEWAERWPDLPARRLAIALAPEGPGRGLDVRAHGPGWHRALDVLGGSR